MIIIKHRNILLLVYDNSGTKNNFSMLTDTNVSYDKQRKDSAHLTNKNINVLLFLLYRTT